MDGGEGGDGHDRYKDGDRLNRWEDTVANVTLGTEPNSHLASAPGLELHHLIMSIIGGHGGRLDIYRDKWRLYSGFQMIMRR